MEYFSTGRPVNSTLSVMTTPDCVEADYDFYSVTQVILGLKQRTCTYTVVIVEE